MRRPTIDVQDLHRSFGATTALDGVTLRADPGQVLALLGPNGAGKTTLVRILATLLSPDSGTARVFGYDVVTQADAVRTRIGLTGQVATVDDLLTGRENLEMIGELHHLRRAEATRRARALLERFDLSDAADRQAHTYSGGMRRRLDLAASLVTSPPVVFLDEPTTGLDPQSRLALWEVIEELVDAGTTVLLTTQYLEEADRLAHQVVVVDHGRVVAQGTTDQLKRHLRGDVIELRTDDHETLRAAVACLATLAGGSLTVEPDHRRLRIAAPDGADTLREALHLLAAARIGVDDIGLHPPSLDDAFLALTGHAADDPDAATDHPAEATGTR
jgi:ABC-2 type transport system ATP-binding protein